MLHIWVGLSSRSIFNDLFAVIRLNLEPCWPTYCLSSAASGPALLSRFTSPSTGIRPQVWQLAALLLSVCVAHNPFACWGCRQVTLPLWRCGLACFPARKVSVSNSTLQVNRKLTIRHKLVYKKITPGKTARYGGSVYSLKMTVSGWHDRPAGQSVKLALSWTVFRRWRDRWQNPRHHEVSERGRKSRKQRRSSLTGRERYIPGKL